MVGIPINQQLTKGIGFVVHMGFNRMDLLQVDTIFYMAVPCAIFLLPAARRKDSNRKTWFQKADAVWSQENVDFKWRHTFMTWRYWLLQVAWSWLIEG